MLGPAPAAWLLVVLSTAAGISCVLRMRGTVRRRRTGRAPLALTVVGDGVEAVMGFGMAVTAVPAAAVAPPAWSWRVLVGVFGALALHAAWSARHGRHHLHHLIGALTMAYMTGVMAWGSHPDAVDHAGHGGSGAPALTGALLLYFTGHVLWSGARLLPAAPSTARDTAGATAPGGWLTSPEWVRACRLSTSIGMLAMLLAL